MGTNKTSEAAIFCKIYYNKMLSETADFAPGAVTWRTRRNIRVVFDSGQFAPFCEKHDVINKTGSTYVLHCRQRRTEPWPQVTWMKI